ncbi:unnamed protein product [Polarella glacialis]|uniref:Deacetylase sirtuin-type domain-containing protein n=1 Tax=Polarella glacialis TaxID=89957 RepID=A0A813D7S9_POLGL|nr:unnamed protein product [Polarella glacialis]
MASLMAPNWLPRPIPLQRPAASAGIGAAVSSWSRGVASQTQQQQQQQQQRLGSPAQPQPLSASTRWASTLVVAALSLQSVFCAGPARRRRNNLNSNNSSSNKNNNNNNFSGPGSARSGQVVCRAVGPAECKAELLALLGGSTDSNASWDSSRVQAAQRVEDLVAALVASYEARKDSAVATSLLEGRWRLLSTFVPGQAAANFFSLDSWRAYVFDKGPSPVQSAAFTSDAVQKVYQALDLQCSPGRWYNVIDALPLGILCLEADLGLEGDDLKFQWTGGFLSVRRWPWSSQDLEQPLQVPYPVPFKLLGDRAKGTFETVYLDEDLRISRGSKSGSIFVLARTKTPLPLEDEYRLLDQKGLLRLRQAVMWSFVMRLLGYWFAGEEACDALCEKHGGLVKPNIVFFGENLPGRFFRLMSQDFAECDLLLVMGTSLQVNPFSSLPREVGLYVPRLLVNRERAGEESSADGSGIFSFAAVGSRTPGFEFDEPNLKDVFFQGDSDDGAQALAEHLGWAEDLQALVKAAKTNKNL